MNFDSYKIAENVLFITGTACDIHTSADILEKI